jgi:hypothetical protein
MHRSIIALRLILALVVALASMHSAVARTASGPAANWIEICAGDQVIALALDAEGNPVASHPTCPDCVIAAGTVPAEAGLAAPLPVTVAVVWVEAAAQWHGPVRLSPVARGPPTRA